ncbi:MAG: N-acetylmuramoyl-L-alanine amidase [Phaeodactylibacter sp.]|nr:N-acetylmuramoyl-L-alanine amidase [Phaeodactylibacter sp.]
MKSLFTVQTIILSLLSLSFLNFNIYRHTDKTTQESCTPAAAPAQARYFGRQAAYLFPEASSAYSLEEALRKAAEFKADPFRLKKIIIDAGHGGYDPGTLGRWSKEKTIALAISLKVTEMIRQRFPDIEVVMTRSDDTFIPLHQRATIANKHNADLFISIHCNYIPNASHVNGTETYVLGQHRMKENLEVAMRENAAVLLEENYEANYGGYDPNSPEGHIMLSMFQNAYLENSIYFAHKVETRMNQGAQRHSRGVKQAGFLVLRETAMPSVLIETGFLSNSTEEQYLMTDAGQDQIAGAILTAFQEYKLGMENGKLSYDSDSTLINTQPLADLRPKTTQVTSKPETASGHVNVSPSSSAKAGPSPQVMAPTQAASTSTPPTTAVASGNEIPVISASPTPIPPTPFSESAQDLQFRVQLAASASPLDTNRPPWAGVNYQV